MSEQLNIFDALASLDPTVIAVMEAEPGWVWAACPACGAFRYIRQRDIGARCILKPGCDGQLKAVIELLCETCGKPVTRRRNGHDTRFCSKKCETA